MSRKQPCVPGTISSAQDAFLPTLIAVFYIILWSWVDPDAESLEPYFQMSKSGGTLFQESANLHSSFDFVAFAPTEAFWKRWHTFQISSSTAAQSTFFRKALVGNFC